MSDITKHDPDYNMTEKELAKQAAVVKEDIAPEETPEKETLLQSLMPVIVLTVICALSGAALAGVKIGTAERIENQLLVNVQGPALQRMFPQAANDPIADRKTLTTASGKEVVVFPVYVNNNLRNVAIEGFGQGYGGDLGVMVGFNLENDTLSNIAITQTKETPGIGSEVGGDRFTKQFKNGTPDEMKLRSQGGKIDALSGATISSTGASNGVQDASGLYQELKPEILKAWQAK